MKPIKCWHFLQNNKRLQWGTKEVVKVGKTYTCKGNIVMCENGLHGSRKILDALSYAPGSICCRVEIWGEAIEGNDKLVGRNRKVLSIIDATEILRKFARMCALDVIHLWYPPDVVVRYLKTGDESLRDAAGDAAWAAKDAIWDAWEAAGDAAWAAWAAGDARDAGDAAGAARNALAARNATCDARDVAGAKQNHRLTTMITRAIK